jgi:hypothetical protein
VSTVQDDQKDAMEMEQGAAGLDPQDKQDIILTLRDEVENRLQEQIQMALDEQEERRKASEASMAATLQEILTNTTHSAQVERSRPHSRGLGRQAHQPR